jgi:tRNA (cytidine/uridine-2'-O-)-methyltransferase
LGFSLEDKLLQRAGLDYHEYAALQVHDNWDAFLRDEHPALDRLFAFTTRGQRGFHQVDWKPGDWLVFGSESAGLPESVRAQVPSDQWLRLPMRPEQRSLNLSNAAAVAVFEAWRQQGYEGSC